MHENNNSGNIKCNFVKHIRHITMLLYSIEACVSDFNVSQVLLILETRFNLPNGKSDSKTR